MARKIQILRGNKAKLPALAQGELALVLDEQSLYGGGSGGNIPLGGKAITPALIGAATTAQVNSAVSTHDSSTTAHNDIRTNMNYIGTAAANAAMEAADAQYTADLAYTAAKAAVKKAGDTMTGTLTVPRADIRDDIIWAQLAPNSSAGALTIGLYDDSTGYETALVVATDGLKFYDRSGSLRTVIHTGNMAQYLGVAQASLE